MNDFIYHLLLSFEKLKYTLQSKIDHLIYHLIYWRRGGIMIIDKNQCISWTDLTLLRSFYLNLKSDVMFRLLYNVWFCSSSAFVPETFLRKRGIGLAFLNFNKALKAFTSWANIVSFTLLASTKLLNLNSFLCESKPTSWSASMISLSLSFR